MADIVCGSIAEMFTKLKTVNKTGQDIIVECTCGGWTGKHKNYPAHVYACPNESWKPKPL